MHHISGASFFCFPVCLSALSVALELRKKQKIPAFIPRNPFQTSNFAEILW